MKSKCLAVLCLWALLSGVLHAEDSDTLLASLAYHGFVNDFAGIFPTNDAAALEAFLQQVKSATRAEIAVVTLENLAGGEIQDFTTRLFEKWKPGEQGKDNGLMLLMAVADRKIWVEVGYGLEGDLPDAKVGRILDDNVIPHFKQTNYPAGLTQGAVALAEVIAASAGLSLTNAPAATAAAAPGDAVGGLIFLIILVVFIVFFIKASRKGWIKSSGGGGGFGGSFSGGSSSGGSSFSFGGGRSGGGGAGRSW